MQGGLPIFQTPTDNHYMSTRLTNPTANSFPIPEPAPVARHTCFLFISILSFQKNWFCILTISQDQATKYNLSTQDKAAHINNPYQALDEKA